MTDAVPFDDVHPDPLIEAVYAQRLAAAAGAGGIDGERYADVVNMCRRIGEHVDARTRDLLPLLEAAGHAATVTSRGARQLHQTDLVVADADAASAIGSELVSMGFDAWDRWSDGARRSFLAHRRQLTFAKTDDYTFVVRVGWPASPRTERIERFGVVRRLFWPTEADWNMVSLPSWAWGAYSIVRPVRLVLERLGVYERTHDDLAPFLSTPESLIAPLLEFADLTPDDHLIDIGCGDGRIVVAAAQQFGCKATGIETSAELVAQAQARVDAAGLRDQVRIEQSNGRDASVADATVVFMFLPFDAIGELLDDTLAHMASPGRIVVHEQTRLPAWLDPRPGRSELLLSEEAVTVAHRWDKP